MAARSSYRSLLAINSSRLGASTPPGVLEGKAGTPAWNGGRNDGNLARGDAVRPGLVARPKRIDPLVQLLQPLQRLLEGLHGHAAVCGSGDPAAAGASPQFGEVGHVRSLLMARARAKASSIPLMGPK